MSSQVTPEQAYDIYIATVPGNREQEVESLVSRIKNTTISTKWVHKMAIVLRYFMEVECLTQIFENMLQLTKTGKVKHIQMFMEKWGSEELTHSILIESVMNQAGIKMEEKWFENRAKAIPYSYQFNNCFIIPILSFFFPNTFRGVHMLWGAINERFTLEGYSRLQEEVSRCQVLMNLEEADLLKEIFGFIKKEEARHLKFYSDCASYYLSQSNFSQRLAFFFVNAWWDIVGSGIMPTEQTDEVVSSLFSGEAGDNVIAKIGLWIRKFPGMDQFNLVSVLVDRKRIKL